MLSITVHENQNVAGRNTDTTFYGGSVADVIGVAENLCPRFLGFSCCVIRGAIINYDDFISRISALKSETIL